MSAYELGPKILSLEIAAPYRRKLGDQVAPLVADLHPGSGCPGLRRAHRRGPGALGTVDPGPVGQLFAVHDQNETRNEI